MEREETAERAQRALLAFNQEQARAFLRHPLSASACSSPDASSKLPRARGRPPSSERWKEEEEEEEEEEGGIVERLFSAFDEDEDGVLSGTEGRALLQHWLKGAHLHLLSLLHSLLAGPRARSPPLRPDVVCLI